MWLFCIALRMPATTRYGQGGQDHGRFGSTCCYQALAAQNVPVSAMATEDDFLPGDGSDSFRLGERFVR